MGICADLKKFITFLGPCIYPYKDRVAPRHPFVEMPTCDENP